jgi:opacity protein-like surface antigen
MRLKPTRAGGSDVPANHHTTKPHTTMKNLYLLTGILTASISAALASSPTPTPSPTASARVVSFRTSELASLHPNAQGASPDGAADRINGTGIVTAVDALASVTTSAGVHSAGKPVVYPQQGPIFSLSGEYNYLNTNDSRLLGSDTQTNGMTVGALGIFNRDTVLGLNYSYNRVDSATNIFGNFNNSDQHFISLIAAKNFMQFLTIGFAGGYGHTDIAVRSAAATAGADVETWSISPFIALSYKTGRLTTSLTTMYQYQNDRTTATGIIPITDDTNKLAVALRASYAATESLKLEGSVKFTEILSGSGQSVGLPVGRNWTTFGAKVSYRVSQPVEIYGSYSYDAFNQFLDTHTVNAGLRYSF